MASTVEVQDLVKIALSSFLAEVAARTTGWWYLLDQEMFEGQKPFDCGEPTPRLSSLIDCSPLLASWILFNAGLLKTSKNWRRTKKPWGPQMVVEKTAWNGIAYEFGLPLEIAHLHKSGKDCFFLRIGEITQLSNVKLKEAHRYRRLPNSFALRDILQDVSHGYRTEPKKPRGLSLHSTRLITNVAEATGFSKILSKISIIKSAKEILEEEQIEQEVVEEEEDDDDTDQDYYEGNTEEKKLHANHTSIKNRNEDDHDILQVDREIPSHNSSLVASVPIFSLPTTPLDGIDKVEDYPAFHRFGIKSHEDVSAMLTDMQKFFGSRPLQFKYKGNEKPGMYQLVRQSSSLKRFREIIKNESFLSNVLQFQARGNNADFDESDAARVIIQCLHDQYNSEFVGVCDDVGMLTHMKQMDAITAATMFEKAGITGYGQQIINKYLQATFGKKCLVPLREVREISNSFIQPSQGVFEWLEDPNTQTIPTKIKYWLKDVSDVLYDSIKNDFQVQWRSIADIRLVFGGDHEGGVFQMFVRVLIRCEDYSMVDHRTYQVGQIDSPKDKALLLKNTIGVGITESVRKITSQHNKITIQIDDNDNITSVTLGQSDTGLVLPIRMHFTGDLKFLFQVVGREGMCGNWCFWCRLSPVEWCLPAEEQLEIVESKNLVPWTLEGIENHRVATGAMSDADRNKPSIVRGTVHNEEAIWNFVEICDFFLPILHIQIGLTNDVLTRFYEFVDELLEPLSFEEDNLRRQTIHADIFLDRAKDEKNKYISDKEEDLKEKREARNELKKDVTKLRNQLKRKKTSAEEKHLLEQSLQSLENRVSNLDDDIDLINSRIERLTLEISECRTQYKHTKNALKAYRQQIGKNCRSLRSELDAILETFGVSAAGYHGGNLNAVSCRALMEQTEIIFVDVERSCLLFVGKLDNNGRKMNTATKEEVERMCKLFSALLRLLGASFSILRRAWGEATEKDIENLKEVLKQVEALWRKLDLSWTPKLHCLLQHSVGQLTESKGYKEFQEDWVEAGHQTGSRDMRIFRSVKDDSKRASCYSQAEKVRNNNKVVTKRLQIKEETTRKRKQDGPTMKEMREKEKQDLKATARAEALEVAKQFSPTKKLTGYETLKKRFKNDEGGFQN